MTKVLITGANRGIGLGLTQRYLEQGAEVIAACRDPSASALKNLSHANKLTTMMLDVTDSQAIHQMTAELEGQAIDILINHAGGGGGDQQSLQVIEAEGWLEVLRVNTISPLLVTRAVLPNLRQAKQPKVFVISSQLGAISYPNIGLYAYESSKAAVNKVVVGMAGDLQEEGIAVFAIHPGWVKTDMGGPDAMITVEESTAGLLQVFNTLSLAKTGSFWQWDGSKHAW